MGESARYEQVGMGRACCEKAADIMALEGDDVERCRMDRHGNRPRFEQAPATREAEVDEVGAKLE